MGHVWDTMENRSESIRVRLSKRQLADVEEVMSNLRQQGENVTMSDIIRNGVEKEIAAIREGGEYRRNRETELWILISDFLFDHSKS